MTIEQLIYKLNQASPETWSYEISPYEDGAYYLMIDGKGMQYMSFESTIRNMDVNSFEAMNYIQNLLTMWD